MVYLHGGAFVMGGGVSYFFGPKLLVEKDLVLVTVQYRLGAFGILLTLNVLTLNEIFNSFFTS